MKKISYSAYKKYMSCPRMYQLHYEDRLRPTTTTSALVFGVAIDVALNALLTGKGDPLGVFQENFKWENLTHVVWDSKDLDVNLFTPDQLVSLSDKDTNYQSWACMRIKGRVILEAYLEYMYPLIKEVHSVQKNLNTRPGVLDAVFTLSDHGVVLADHKTSSMPYQANALETDTQLALYSADQGISKVAYIVMSKSIRFIKTCGKCGFDGSFTQHKTCPNSNAKSERCHGTFNRSVDKSKVIQLIVGDVREINKNNILKSIDTVEKCINNKLFPMNVNSCMYMFGKPCPYVNKCWNNRNDGLEVKEETKPQEEK
jgi:hypothetical protein